MDKSNLDLISFPLERNCFGCSQTNPSGLQLNFYTEANSSKIYSFFIPSQEHVGWGNIIHGGIAATIMDEMSSWVVITNKKQMCVTLKLELKYHGVLNTEAEYTVIGEIAAEKGRCVEVSSYICNAAGKKLVSAMAKMMVLSAEKAKSMNIMSDTELQAFNYFLNS